VNKLRQMPIGRQIFIVTLVLCALVFATLITVVSRNMERTAATVAEQDLQSQLKIVAELMEYAYRQGINRVKRNSAEFITSLPGKVTVEAKTIQTGPTELPIVKVGDEVMNGNTRWTNSRRARASTPPS